MHVNGSNSGWRKNDAKLEHIHEEILLGEQEQMGSGALDGMALDVSTNISSTAMGGKVGRCDSVSLAESLWKPLFFREVGCKIIR